MRFLASLTQKYEEHSPGITDNQPLTESSMCLHTNTLSTIPNIKAIFCTFFRIPSSFGRKPKISLFKKTRTVYGKRSATPCSYPEPCEHTDSMGTEGRRLTRAPVVEMQRAQQQRAGLGQQQVRQQQRWCWQQRQQHLLSSILPQLLAHRHNQIDQVASATRISVFHFKIPTAFSAQKLYKYKRSSHHL